MFKLALICGGPSDERGISLNSARSVMDHLKSESIEIIPIYVDLNCHFYLISTAQLYSNTPADFDFKLDQMAIRLNVDLLINILKEADLVFPIIHGRYGEDGQLQELLETYQIAFVGHTSSACKWMFYKHQATKTLKENGFKTLPQLVLRNNGKDQFQEIVDFFSEHQLNRAVIKPSLGGSSIGVFSIQSPIEAFSKMEVLFLNGHDPVILEPFCQGREFTVVLLESLEGGPVACIPSEIEMDYQGNQIFDYRKKYLPTHHVIYHTPPTFNLSDSQKIRNQAEEMFTLFNMRDFARLDGWLLEDGSILFTDINPISGMEQNSFLFRQTSLLGMNHRETLSFILKKACKRYGIDVPIGIIQESKIDIKKRVYVLFGGENAERQVSLMSGTNVWLKLLQSKNYSPFPFFLDQEKYVWLLPYSFTLNHTVEEIYQNCLSQHLNLENWQIKIEEIRNKLGITSPIEKPPSRYTLEQFLTLAKEEEAFVFIALHGGIGEDGTLQKELEMMEIPFNGSKFKASQLCMDKYLTGKIIEELNHPYLCTTPKKMMCFTDSASVQYEALWLELCAELKTERMIVKPRLDGCSAGIALLQSSKDLERYSQLINQKQTFIPAYSFANQSEPIEMPSNLEADFLLEPYIETDIISINNGKIALVEKEGWIELTNGVLEKNGEYHALNPSITIAMGAVLSLEEKFQGGTGINLTPPPFEILTKNALEKIKRGVEEAAKALRIENYARLDIFYHRLTEKIILIEANSLPGLTPSTVIYHQGFAENPPLDPLQLIEKIIYTAWSERRVFCN